MNETPADGEPLHLGRQASGALGWSLANTAAGKLGTLVIGVALARILGPEEFGTFAVAMVALLAVLSINELGVSLAIVRWRQDPAAIVPTVTTLALGSSLLLFAAGWLLTPAFASAMGAPQATGAVRVMLVSVVVNGAVASSAALLQREFRQRQRMVADQVNTWLGAFVSLALAVAGWGAMALAVGRVTGSLAAAVLLLKFAPQGLRLGVDTAMLRPLLRFGLPLAGASAVVFTAGYADQLVVGSMLGPTELGLFVLAFNLASWPVSMFSQPLRAVAPAAFARLQHDPDRMAGVLVRVAGGLAAVAVPVCLLLAGAAGPIVRVVYGAEWADAAHVLAWLGVAAAGRIVAELFYDYLVVLRRTGRVLGVQLAWLATMIPAVVIGASVAGAPGAAAAETGVLLAVTLPLYLALLHREGISPRRILGRLVLPAVGGVLVLFTGLFVSRAVEPDWVAAGVAGAVALLVSLLLLARERSSFALLRTPRPAHPAAVGGA